MFNYGKPLLTRGKKARKTSSENTKEGDMSPSTEGLGGGGGGAIFLVATLLAMTRFDKGMGRAKRQSQGKEEA